MTTRVLTRPGGRREHSPYIETGSYPWYTEVGLHATQEGAVQAAQEWADLYVSQAPMARMACVHGVVKLDVEDNCCWAGVVNYYHSNS